MTVLPTSRAPAASAACDDRRRRGGRGVTCEPVRISAAGVRAGDVDQVLHREGEAIEPPAPGRFPDARRPRNEGAEGPPVIADRGHVADGVRVHQRALCARRAAMIAFELVTKPKHFFTFQIVASVQKSGDVVAQQSLTSRQP